MQNANDRQAEKAEGVAQRRDRQIKKLLSVIVVVVAVAVGVLLLYLDEHIYDYHVYEHVYL